MARPYRVPEPADSDWAKGGTSVSVLRFPRRRRASPATAASDGRASARSIDARVSTSEAEWPANLRFLLTPDNDPALDYLDTLTDLELLDDTEREARIAAARLTGS